MKGLFSKIIIALAAVLAMTSCTKSEEAVLKDLTGEWYYETTENDTDIQVYLSFSKDRTFEIFQKVGDGAFRRYSGTYTYDGTILDGVYSDKQPFAHKYSVTREGDVLTLQSVDGTDAVSYNKKTIPATVRYHYTEPMKSSADETVAWL